MGKGEKKKMIEHALLELYTDILKRYYHIKNMEINHDNIFIVTIARRDRSKIYCYREDIGWRTAIQQEI